MEILAIFFLISAIILGFLCLLVLEYQNHRTKQWHQIKISPKMPPAASYKAPSVKQPASQKSIHAA